MRTWEQEQREKLAAQFPLGELWTVRLYLGGYAWCARRHDDHNIVLNAESPDELAEYINEYEKA